MPGVSAASKRQPLTLAQISSYDDILTDALVDHVSAAVRKGPLATVPAARRMVY